MPSFRSLLPWFVALAVLLGATLKLWTQGQPLWCSCGSWIPWSFDIWSKHNSQHLLDPYSGTHVEHGVIFFGGLYLTQKWLPLEWRLALAVAIESLWELVENSPFIINRYREATISLDYFGDSVLNSVADIACCAFGFFLASRFSWKISLAFLVAVELVLLFAIRDNLAINIIMLAWPIDAIKAWQSGG